MSQSPQDAVLALADIFYRWLAAPVTLSMAAAPVTYEQAGGPGVPTVFREGTTVAILTDTQQVTLAVEPEDSKGEPAPDTLTWSSSDTNVITLTVAPDTLSALAVAGAPGTAVVTVTDGTLSATDSIDVTSGPVASLVITEGTPEPQP
jgi:hypothetical protein